MRFPCRIWTLGWNKGRVRTSAAWPSDSARIESVVDTCLGDRLHNLPDHQSPIAHPSSEHGQARLSATLGRVQVANRLWTLGWGAIRKIGSYSAINLSGGTRVAPHNTPQALMMAPTAILPPTQSSSSPMTSSAHRPTASTSRRRDWDAAGEADDACSRCRRRLTLSASLAHAASPPGLGDLTESSLLDSHNLLASAGITGLLGLSTYDLIPHGGIPGTPADLASAPRPTTTADASVPTDKGGSSNPKPAPSALPDPSKHLIQPNSKVLVRQRLMELLNAHNPPLRPSSGQSGPPPSSPSDVRSTDGVIHHPLCSHCTNDMLGLMEAELSLLRTERGALGHVASILTSVDRQWTSGERANDEPTPAHHLPELVAKEQAARQTLVQSEQEKHALQAQLRQLDEEEAQLKREEDEFWTEFSASSSDLAALKSESAQLKQTIALDTALLLRLQSTNVYHDVFSIGHDHGYSTINGLRLGKGSIGSNDKVVEWDEINAAWGQTLLLLDTIATKLDFEFTGYTLHPKGSFSSIARAHEEYELYYLPSWSVESLWGKTAKRYDRAMEAFLECLRQLMVHTTSVDPSVRFPHQVNRDKIGEVSLRLPTALLGRNAGGGEGDQAWTRACR